MSDKHQSPGVAYSLYAATPNEVEAESDVLIADNLVDIDVLVVCQHDADMVRRCLLSCVQGAYNRVRLYVWQNSYDPQNEEAAFIGKMISRMVFSRAVRSWRGATSLRANDGFIVPNNELAKLGTAPYICLLNADTICAPGWDRPLIDALDGPAPIAEIVGYGGGMLGNDGVGIARGAGDIIDYVEGWCLCLARATWERLGGFDEKNLTLAYGEDSDLCLRAREQGCRIVALENVATDCYGPLGDLSGTSGQWVRHLGGQGASSEARAQVIPHFAANHVYLWERHREYIEKHRVLVRGYERPATVIYGDDEDDYAVRRGRRLALQGWGDGSLYLNCFEVDGRLWQLDVPGRSERFLVP